MKKILISQKGKRFQNIFWIVAVPTQIKELLYDKQYKKQKELERKYEYKDSITKKNKIKGSLSAEENETKKT